MTVEEIDIIVSQLKPYTKSTLIAEVSIHGIGQIELEIEVGAEKVVNSELLKSILGYITQNIESIKEKGNILLNSFTNVKEFKSPKVNAKIDFNLVGISINNYERIHNQFKLVFDYDYELIHQNEDLLGYRTVNYSGSKNQFYLSGVNWIY
ncbi:MAG: hypothetical protein ACJATI_005612 [Halioglobus sp.]|jgi:hypothetical protein